MEKKYILKSHCKTFFRIQAVVGDSGRTGNMRRTGTLKIQYYFGTYFIKVAFFLM